MKRILHIVGKDVRRMRTWVWLWVVLFGLHVGVGFCAIHPSIHLDGDLRVAIEAANRALTMGEAALCFLLALLWTQEDGVLRATDFWRTRPIQPWRMLLAKAVGLLLVAVIAPMLVALPWWWYCGFAPDDFSRGAAGIFMWHGGICAVALLIGFATDSLRRALLWSLVPLAMVVAIGAMRQASGSLDSFVGPEVFIGTTIALVVALLVVVQFLTRRTAIMVAGLGLAILTVPQIPLRWHAWAEKRARAAMNAEAASGIQVVSAETWQSEARTMRKQLTNMNSEFVFSGVPAGHALRLVRAEYRVKEPTGGDVVLRGGSSGHEYFQGLESPSGPLREVLQLGVAVNDPETDAWFAERMRKLDEARREHGLRLARESTSTGATISTHVFLGKNMAEKVRADPEICETQLTLSLMQLEHVHSYPWGATHWQRFRGGAMSIHEWQAEKQPGVWRARVVQVRPRSILDGFRAFTGQDRLFETPHYVLVHRTLGQLLGMQQGRVEKPGLVLVGVEIAWREWRLAEPKLRRGTTWERYPSWGEGATFGLVRANEVARFVRASGLGPVNVVEPRKSTPKPAQ